MKVKQWTKRSFNRIKRDGIEGLRASARPVYNKALEQGNYIRPRGENIYDEDWDLLVVADACRLDLMKEMKNKYDFINDIESIWSLDSTTAQWMEKTFVEKYNKEIQKTNYICGNPFSATKLSNVDFGQLIEVWRHSWLDIGTVPPRAITDHTIAVNRGQSQKRTIAHYMQPHCPFIPHPELMSSKEKDKWGNQDTKDVWERLRDNELTEKEVWAAYRNNLEIVLDEIKLLLQNIDADNVIITSDHGNAKGEWNIYGHPPGSPLRCLREVPWIQTSASDVGDYEPNLKDAKENKVSRERKLQALGYIE
ncbi:hypothetical protein [Haladaptatus salinisoli]|uniref:hypothetical protein n=1 Tax=Haladaptatus salinisoli TaxID=2884876 RepID=UPI001D0A3135|nr:hypothetical protein [Haladaptatus salinisoli]